MQHFEELQQIFARKNDYFREKYNRIQEGREDAD